MQLGGWWRPWIELSVLWVIAAGAFALFAVERPTSESEAKRVGLTCDLDMPVTPALAPKVLEVPGLLAQLNGLEGDAHAGARKPVVQRIKANVEAVAANAGKGTDYAINVVASPDGNRSLVVAPTHFTDEQVFEEAGKSKYSLNSWASFGDYCTEQLRAQAQNELYPKHLKEWVVGTLAGVLSFPLLTLLLGSFVGWVRRGFRRARIAESWE